MNTDNKTQAFSLSRIRSTGITRRYQKKILEVIAATGTGVSLVYAAVLWFGYQSIYSSLTDCVYALAYLWTFYWIRQGSYALSAYWLIIWATVQIVTGSVFFVGPETGFQLYFLTLPVIVFFLLSSQPRWAQIALMVYGAACFIASHTIHVPTFMAPIPTGISQMIFILNALIVFGVVYFVVKFFADEIETAYKEQQKLVQVDRLTGLSNDRFIFQHASKLLSLCDRYGHPFSLIVIDLDHFKQTNELYGHAVGDEILKRVANILLEDIRDADILARVGGDDFVILLPETMLEEAGMIAQRLCDSIRQTKIKADEATLSLSASMGISYCDSNAMSSIEELISAASDARKQARVAGGNQIKIAQDVAA